MVLDQARAALPRYNKEEKPKFRAKGSSMDTFQHSDTQNKAIPTTKPDGWATWRALPRQLISPQWRWQTLIVIVIAFGFIRLGMWQLQRLGERRAQNAVIASRTVQPALSITGAAVDVAAQEYRRVRVRGTFDYANEIVLRTQSRNGVAGVEIITPLRIAGSDQHVLVNRGWVPLLQYDARALQQYAVPGEVEIEGILRKPQPRTTAIGPIDRQPSSGRLETWFRVDVARIAEQVPYPLLPFFIEQLPVPDAPALPDPQPDIQLAEGSHLSYAIQWFSFAGTGLAGYATLVATRTRKDAAPTSA